MPQLPDLFDDWDNPADAPSVTSSAGNGQKPHLRQFCEAVLELLKSEAGEGVILSRVLPSLVQAIQEGSRGTVELLREQLAQWEAVSDSLGQLSRSPLLPFGGDAAKLLEKLQHAQSQAGRVADALAALQSLAPTTATSSLACPPIKPKRRLKSGTGISRSGRRAPQRSTASQISRRGSRRFKRHLLERRPRCWSARRCRIRDSARGLLCRSTSWQAGGMPRLARLHAGRIHLLQGQPELAVEELTGAIRLQEDDPLAYWWRGDAHAICGRYQDAIQDYTRTLELRPDLFLVRYNRAVSRRLAGKLELSLAEFDELVESRPAHGPLYLNRGLIYQARGDSVRATEEFRAALVRQPESQEALRRLRELETPQIPPSSNGETRSRNLDPVVHAAQAPSPGACQSAVPKSVMQVPAPNSLEGAAATSAFPLELELVPVLRDSPPVERATIAVDERPLDSVPCVPPSGTQFARSTSRWRKIPKKAGPGRVKTNSNESRTRATALRRSLEVAEG